MHSHISADCSAMPVCPDRTAGVLDVLANYWFKCIEFVNVGELKAKPEMSLDMASFESLACCFKPYGLVGQSHTIEGMFEDGFTMGIRVAALLTCRPLDAEKSMRQLVDEMALTLKKRREDEKASRIARSPKSTEES
jgi:hypothetical protein